MAQASDAGRDTDVSGRRLRLGIVVALVLLAVLGLRLVDTHGLAPAPTRAIVRALLSVVSFGLFLGGFWMALFDRRGQTLHDKLTSTFVVQPS